MLKNAYPERNTLTLTLPNPHFAIYAHFKKE